MEAIFLISMNHNVFLKQTHKNVMDFHYMKVCGHFQRHKMLTYDYAKSIANLHCISQGHEGNCRCSSGPFDASSEDLISRAAQQLKLYSRR